LGDGVFLDARQEGREQVRQALAIVVIEALEEALAAAPEILRGVLNA